MLPWNCAIYQCSDCVSASYTNLSQAPRPSEKGGRSRKKENSPVYSLCVCWICSCAVSEAFQDGNYVGLAIIVVSFLLLVFGIVYVQEAERKISLNYASRYGTKSGELQRSAYLPFKVNSYR
ncbi:preprotein translocase subunit SECY, chloroplastic-like [Aristolochia californica]|uniref:preprotein translocase subunit SECY, chloroplastic-like n=1 Tax=Aristolochia californica TaxID=171875 RepID=UPI0035D560B1